MKTKLLILIMVLLAGIARAQETTLNGVVYTLNTENHTAAVSGTTDELPADVTIPASITVGNTAYSVTAIGRRAFINNPLMKSIQLPVSLREIGNDAFGSCSELTQIVIPEGVTTIGEGAFAACTGLTDIRIPDGVTRIEYLTFAYNNLKSVHLPANLTFLGKGAFFQCSELTGITIPDGVTSIGEQAFDGCSKLESVQLPAKLDSIATFAFYECTSLTGITLPKGVTKINHKVFSGCSSLASITVSKDNAVFSDIRGVLFSKDQTTLVAYPQGKTDSHYAIPEGTVQIGTDAFEFATFTSVNIPSTVTTIRNAAFFRCENLKSVHIPDGVTRIAESAFYMCSSLGSINLPKDITIIKYTTFRYCGALTSICIPAKVSSIEEQVFEGCDMLATICCEAQTPPTIDEKTFSSYTPTLFVPTGSLAAYQSAPHWSNFTQIREGEAGITTAQAADGVIYSDGMLTLSGSETPTQVTIYTSSGSQVSVRQLAPGESYDLGWLPAGIYLIKATAGEKIMRAKIIR